MTQEDFQKVREVELLRKAWEESKQLCETLDLCEFVEPLDFEADIDANQARKALERRLRVAESALLRDHVNRHGRVVVSLTA